MSQGTGCHDNDALSTKRLMQLVSSVEAGQAGKVLREECLTYQGCQRNGTPQIAVNEISLSGGRREGGGRRERERERKIGRKGG